MMQADPHATDYFTALIAVVDPADQARWQRMQLENDEVYTMLLETGIEFRGWRFWPPFYCMYCGGPISTSQWLFARSHDTPAEGRLAIRMPGPLAGRFEPAPMTVEAIRRPIGVDTPEGRELIEYAKLYIR